MSTIGGTASNNEMQHKSFLTPAGRDASLVEYGNVSGDIVALSGGTADEAFQALLDVVAAPSPANPYNLGDTNQSPSSTTNLLNGLKMYQLTSTSGHVLQAKITNVGTGYAAVTTANATGGSGSNCQVEVVSHDSGKVTGIKILNNGSGYSNGETLTITGGGGNATIQIFTVVYFRTMLYTHESHGVGAFTSTVAQMKSQELAYTGNNTTSTTTMDYGAVGIAVPKVFDEPLTVVSKPSANTHRVILGQARNPHASIGGKRIASGGTFPGTFGIVSGNGILYSALDIICQNPNNALEVGDQITMPANIRGQLSDSPGFYSWAHVLDDDHIVLFTNVKMASAADLIAPAVPSYLAGEADRTFVGLGFENGTPSGTDQFTSPVIANPQFLAILGSEYTNAGTLIIPTHVKRISLYPKDNDAFLRRGVYHENEAKMGPDFDGEIISAVISTAGTGYGTVSGQSFTTSGGSGRGSGFTFDTDTNSGAVTSTNLTITASGDDYLPGEILDVVGGAGSGAKVTVTSRGNSTLPFILLPKAQATEIVVDTGHDCALTLVSTSANDIVYVQYLTG